MSAWFWAISALKFVTSIIDIALLLESFEVRREEETSSAFEDCKDNEVFE
jgi:hypothetical protein